MGPATASLLLSVAYPEDVPFFADEILGWLRAGKEKAQVKLKYDWKEYKEVWEGVRALRDAAEKGAGEGERVSAEDVERGAWVVEMVRGMGLENAAVAEKEDGSGMIEEGEGNEGLQTGGMNVREKVGIEDEDSDILSAKDAGRQDDRASTRVSARQKRKIPPSVSPPTATAKKNKKASKDSKRPQAGELATGKLPGDPADANEGEGSRRLSQRRRPPKASYRGKAPRGPLQGPLCV